MTATTDPHQITSVEQLRERIGSPSELVPHKLWTELDESCMDFIQRSPFLLLATADAEGKSGCLAQRGRAGGLSVLRMPTHCSSRTGPATS